MGSSRAGRVFQTCEQVQRGRRQRALLCPSSLLRPPPLDPHGARDIARTRVRRQCKLGVRALAPRAARAVRLPAPHRTEACCSTPAALARGRSWGWDAVAAGRLARISSILQDLGSAAYRSAFATDERPPSLIRLPMEDYHWLAVGAQEEFCPWQVLRRTCLPRSRAPRAFPWWGCGGGCLSMLVPRMHNHRVGRTARGRPGWPNDEDCCACCCLRTQRMPPLMCAGLPIARWGAAAHVECPCVCVLACGIATAATEVH